MTRFIWTTALIVTAASAAPACLYERQVVRERPVAVAQNDDPPPPPQDDLDDQPAVSAQDVPAPGQQVETEVFTERLSPYGHWQYVADYGNVWVPVVASGWRPYYYGHWVLTDWGWTWSSDEPWGWAAYHYGRWGFGPSVGWYWIPGSVWAPAWVSWRYGGGYAAWCPLGPAGYYYGYSHPAWVAVREDHFTRPVATYALSPHATAPAVQQAQPLSGPHATVARNGAYGPPVAKVQAAVGQPIHAVSAAAVVHAQPHPSVGSGGDTRGGAPRTSEPMGPRATSPGAGASSGPRTSPGYPGSGSPRSGGPVTSPPAPRGGESGPRAAPPPPRQGNGNAGAPRAQPAPRPNNAPRYSPPPPRATGGGGGYRAPAPAAPAPSRGGGNSHKK